MLAFTSIINLVSYVIMLISIWTLTINTSGNISHSEVGIIGGSHFLSAFA
ncbi:MAG: hypothetical protein WAW59_01365 [Patescibacteria group bacterium]